MLNIGAFTFNYDHVEDRILLIGNLNNKQPRIDFWLTRKLVLCLLEAAKGLVEKTSEDIANLPEQQKSQMAQFHHEQAQHELDVEPEAEVEAQSGGLLYRLDISNQADRYKLIFFDVQDEPLASSILSYQELHQVLYLLHRGAKALDWGVDDELFGAPQTHRVLQ